ncbi:hypothetical protein NDU88_001071 [Pleurodeles waltl]|uniref:Reverse transcriptase RNase H-like domain-containing protein n=1 Tax=Pleurodeles waltl TaxID=8319 RepID=A0AAV7MIP9_PLEWA|nr:hypothetical protein NDU88_001071 [Pleurodeles waltl]
MSLAGHTIPHHHVRLSAGVKEDLKMWCIFLESFNGIPIRAWPLCEWDVQIYSDASGASGFGIYWQGKFCVEEWPPAWRAGGRSIAFLELFPLVVAVCVWGQWLMHKRVLFRVDNMAVVQVINRQSAREAQVLQLLRVFVLECLLAIPISGRDMCRGE